jgi:hypothetical protein
VQTIFSFQPNLWCSWLGNRNILFLATSCKSLLNIFTPVVSEGRREKGEGRREKGEGRREGKRKVSDKKKIANFPFCIPLDQPLQYKYNQSNFVRVQYLNSIPPNAKKVSFTKNIQYYVILFYVKVAQR